VCVHDTNFFYFFYFSRPDALVLKDFSLSVFPGEVRVCVCVCVWVGGCVCVYVLVHVCVCVCVT